MVGFNGLPVVLALVLALLVVVVVVVVVKTLVSETQDKLNSANDVLAQPLV